MQRRQALKLLAGLSLCPLCAWDARAADAHWSYEGSDGPANWGNLDPTNRVCSTGVQQSPIDIRDPIRAQLAPLRVIWEKRAETIVNTGRTVQLNMGEASVLGYGSANYRLLQFHFHHPSEHLIAGRDSSDGDTLRACERCRILGSDRRPDRGGPRECGLQ